MSLQEHKLTDYAVSIAGLPDKIENKAQWLKQQFDARTDSEVRDRHNSLIDALDEDLAGRPTNESMAGAIDEKVVELGAGDMAQGVYDPGHRRQDVFAYADAVRRYAEGSSETLPRPKRSRSQRGQTGWRAWRSAGLPPRPAPGTRPRTTCGRFRTRECATSS